MSDAAPSTILVFGDQLNKAFEPLNSARPGVDEVAVIFSDHKISSRPWHRQRLHLIVTAMHRFASELKESGFTVKEIGSASMREGIDELRRDRPSRPIRAMAPSTFAARALLDELGLTVTADQRFLTDPKDAEKLFLSRARWRMDDFYRYQRKRLGYLMEGETPVGGRWSFDEENRRPLPREGIDVAPPVRVTLDERDFEVLSSFSSSLPGATPTGLWPTTRAHALSQLRRALSLLDYFGPYEDAMSAKNWHVAHTLLSPALNLGLLTPKEVADAVQDAYDHGRAPIASAEGLIRQIIGWREYVWCAYWSWGPNYAKNNALGATNPLPAAFDGGATQMACLGNVLEKVEKYGYAHHIERLMVLGNLSLLVGVTPALVTAWMHERFVDGAEWVMTPNVVGMALYADGGQMATKPYAAGGAYIKKMSDHCKGCRYRPTQRTGDDACPFTTLYWDFLDRHNATLSGNHRLSRQLAAARQRPDMPEIRERAQRVIEGLLNGEI